MKGVDIYRKFVSIKFNYVSTGVFFRQKETVEDFICLVISHLKCKLTFQTDLSQFI